LDAQNSFGPTGKSRQVVGILPLVSVKHLFLGSHLVSTAFLDSAGVLANNQSIEKLLVDSACKIARETDERFVELRQREPLSWMHSSELSDPVSDVEKCHHSTPRMLAHTTTYSHKIRMVLELPESSDALMASFKSKLRSQIKKPIKEGLITHIGGIELIDDFYKVFTTNMRDLGSPVHSKNLIKNVFTEFKDKCRILVVYFKGHAVAGAVVVGFKQVLHNPWASALRQYSMLSPNMLLYWSMLEYACNQGYRSFDFGRSTPDETTYKFKEQWGCKPMPLNWHLLSVKGNQVNPDNKESLPFQIAIRYWRRLPVPITRVIGPYLRKRIAL
jgi:FemAB-related protein (PEP-CTERM system-associated)